MQGCSCMNGHAALQHDVPACLSSSSYSEWCSLYCHYHHVMCMKIDWGHLLQHHLTVPTNHCENQTIWPLEGPDKSFCLVTVNHVRKVFPTPNNPGALVQLVASLPPFHRQQLDGLQEQCGQHGQIWVIGFLRSRCSRIYCSLSLYASYMTIMHHKRLTYRAKCTAHKTLHIECVSKGCRRNEMRFWQLYQMISQCHSYTSPGH